MASERSAMKDSNSGRVLRRCSICLEPKRSDYPIIQKGIINKECRMPLLVPASVEVHLLQMLSAYGFRKVDKDRKRQRESVASLLNVPGALDRMSRLAPPAVRVKLL